MKNNTCILLTLTAFTLGVGLPFVCKIDTRASEKHKLISTDAIQVAILQPVTHPALEQIKQGFKEQLQKKSIQTIEFKEYNGNGNGTLMRAQAEEIVATNPNLIFTIATGPALLIKELTIRKNKLIPVICGAAAQEKVLPPGETASHITGNDDMIFQEQQIAMLKFLKPNIANLLLVYDGNSAGLEKSIRGLEATCKNFNLNLIKVPLFSVSEITQKTAPFINQVDTIIVLKDSMIVTGLDTLVKICNQKGITLMASDLDSVDRGAALAFGVSEYAIGVESAEQALKILNKYKTVKEVPFSTLQNAKIKVNSQTAERQGLTLSKDLLFAFEHGELYKGKNQ